MDGVIFNSVGFSRGVFLKRHPGVTEAMYNEIHIGNYHEGASKYHHLEIKQTEAEKNQHRLNYAEGKSKVPVFPGMDILLSDLHKLGYLIVLNTNAYNRTCLPLLERSKMRVFFDFLTTADTSTDKVEKFKLIEDKYKADKKDILFITDALGDLRDADIAKIPTLVVTWGVHDKNYFTREKHDNLIGIFDKVEELSAFLKNFS